MKRIFVFSILALCTACMLVVLPGCNKKISDFGDLNKDPSNPTDPIPTALLSNVTSGLGNWIFDGNYYRNTSVPAMFCQYFAQTQYTEESRYIIPNFDWDIYYAGRGEANATDNYGMPRANLMDVQTIINLNTDPATKEEAAKYGSNNNQLAIARILKSYLFWMLTDQYGDLPYKGALKGVSQVPYDPQAEIYAGMLSELTEAVAQFDDGTMPAGDLLFNGDQAKWKKFANSLRLLMALRMSKADPTKAKTEFNAALNAGVIEDNADNAVLNYPGGTFLNPFYEYYNVIQRKDISPTTFLVGWLKSHNDPRLGVYASTEVGFPYGLTRENAVGFATDHPDFAFAMNADYYNDPTSPMYLVTASHIWLARAEAALLGWIPEAALTDYNKGIEMAWKQWGVYDAGKYATYIASPDIILAGTPEQMKEKVDFQRWLAFYPDGKQGWALWRKTGYPKLTPAPGTNVGIPARIPYGTNEASLNGENYKKAAEQYNADGKPNSQNSKLWWAK